MQLTNHFFNESITTDKTGLRLKQLDVYTMVSEANKVKRKYIRDGYYSTLKKVTVTKFDSNTKKDEPIDVFVVLGIKIIDLQNKIDDLNNTRRIEIGLLKELIFSDDLPNKIVSKISDNICSQHNADMLRYDYNIGRG